MALSSETRPGGKGGNQAAASAQWGVVTALVAHVGDDADGVDAVDDLGRRGVDVDEVRRIAGAATGKAVVLVDENGENSIVVASGANAGLTPDHVREALDRRQLGLDDVILTSGEITEPCVMVAAETAVAVGALHIHNLAPARAFACLEQLTGILVVNLVEMSTLTHQPDPELGALALAEGRLGAVVTLGAAGAIHASGTDLYRTPALRVARVIDTTGAGDAFCAALAAELAFGSDLASAVRMAVRAGAVAVGAVGARGALASRTDLAES